jgi:hypothetical protein
LGDKSKEVTKLGFLKQSFLKKIWPIAKHRSPPSSIAHLFNHKHGENIIYTQIFFMLLGALRSKLTGTSDLNNKSFPWGPTQELHQRTTLYVIPLTFFISWAPLCITEEAQSHNQSCP